MNIDEARSFWKVASGFPPEKETVYREHADAHEFDEQAKGRVLEYGCGGGSDTISLLRRGADVFFLDIVPENVATTRTRVATLGKGGLGAVLEASDMLPFNDAAFDSVNCHGVLHHIQADVMERVIAEFWRVLRPGGCLYAMLYTEVLFSRYQHAFPRDWPTDKAFSYVTDGGGIARAYTEADGRALFERLGFEVERAVLYNNADFRTFKARKPSLISTPSPEDHAEREQSE